MDIVVDVAVLVVVVAVVVFSNFAFLRGETGRRFHLFLCLCHGVRQRTDYHRNLSDWFYEFSFSS